MNNFKVKQFDDGWYDSFAAAEPFKTGENPLIGENSEYLISIDSRGIWVYTQNDESYIPTYDLREISYEEALSWFKFINLNPKAFINSVLSDWEKIS